MSVDQRLRTRATELFGVPYPIVQTGMGWVAGPSLVIGAAEAGGLGVLASATMTLDEMDAAIAEVRSRTERPFGVNLRPDAIDLDDRAERLVRAGVRVASFAGPPPARVVRRLRDGGVLVMPTVGARRHAEKMAELGADAILC
ncbi:MAG: nitronate monooxygenase, partial [Acidimicrobiaceae bacterium]|nr:nitronate monooxygenase [Acidimicrobiaceae bacterium]